MFITSVSSHRVQLFFGTGLLLSSTTYSTFAVRTTSLSPADDVLDVGANYALGSVVAALGLMFGGRR